jgi:hypothetical protein
MHRSHVWVHLWAPCESLCEFTGYCKIGEEPLYTLGPIGRRTHVESAGLVPTFQVAAPTF